MAETLQITIRINSELDAKRTGPTERSERAEGERMRESEARMNLGEKAEGCCGKFLKRCNEIKIGRRADAKQNWLPGKYAAKHIRGRK
jgi:hypothetical protein